MLAEREVYIIQKSDSLKIHGRVGGNLGIGQDPVVLFDDLADSQVKSKLVLLE